MRNASAVLKNFARQPASGFCTRDLLGEFRNRTIAEIAFAAGFRDISHFNRLFKRKNGASPASFVKP
jgi:AraC-like DNA-binding protein